MRLAVLVASLMFACGGQDRSGSASVGPLADAGVPAGLVAISLSQTDVHIPAGANTAFAVTGTSSDGTRSDVTQQASATSSDENVVTLQKGPGSQIQIFAHQRGTATITVTVGTLQQTCNVTVT